MRNSLYSISQNEALENVGAKHKYQKRVLGWGVCVFSAIGIQIGGCLTGVVIQNDGFTSVVISAAFVLAGVIYSGMSIFLGRKAAVFIGLGIMIIGNLISLMQDLFWMIGALSYIMFYVGGLISGISVISMLVEVCDNWQRVYYVMIVVETGATVLLITCVATYNIFDQIVWVVLVNISISIFGIPGLFIYESPRYLGSVLCQYKNAREILCKIATINGFPPLNEFLEGEKMIGYHESTNRIERSTNNINDESLSKKYNVVSISNSIIGLSDAQEIGKIWIDLGYMCKQSTALFFVICYCISFIISSSVLYYGVNIVLEQSIWFFIYSLIFFIALIPIFSLLINTVGRQLIIVLLSGIQAIVVLFLLSFVLHDCEKNDNCEVDQKIIYVSQCIIIIVGFLGVYMMLIQAQETLATSIKSQGFSIIFVSIGIGISLLTLVQFLSNLIEINELLLLALIQTVNCFINCAFVDKENFVIQDYTEEEINDMQKPSDIEVGSSERLDVN